MKKAEGVSSSVMDPVHALLDRLTERPSLNSQELRQLKRAIARQSGEPFLRNDVLLSRYRTDVLQGVRQPSRQLEQTLLLNAIRSTSGIATVTVITKPYPCPGRCVYCPTEARAPKSYLANEPAMMRAIRNDYDPYRQVISRLTALDETGHPTTKIELIVKGGTWSFYPDAYQRWFITRCFEAANDFGGNEGRGARGEGRVTDRPVLSSSGARAFFIPRPLSPAPCPLEEAHQRNETAAHRIIGVTIETRPDYITEIEIRRLRELGVTRVELGVQTLNDRILELIVRDHTTAEIRQATALLRDAGFKVAYHLMPNLPGAIPEDDLQTFRTLFEDPAYRPDAMKIYPCVVIKTAELYQWWREERYQPYDEETLIELLVQLKALVPPYVRIERVIRDIPSTSIEAGCAITNLREAVLRRMRSRGQHCRCIRCREVRDVTEGSFVLVRREYDASGGKEIFLSIEDPTADKLAALLRLRIPSSALRGKPHWLAGLDGAALIRELHTYGRHLPLHNRQAAATQHRGFGRRLTTEAERIVTEEFGLSRIAVIAGAGVREYYRALGYALQDTYMVKTFNPLPNSNGHPHQQDR